MTIDLSDPMILIAVAFFTCISVFVSVLVLIPISEPLSLIDKPSNRKRHKNAVPAIGGLAIYLVIIAAIVIFNYQAKLYWFMFSVSILVFIGALDDAFCLGVRIRFASQVLATVVMLSGSSLWIHSLGLSAEWLDVGTRWLGIPVTIFAVVGLTNGFNMADGIDGLASGQMLVGLVSVCLTLYLTHGYVYQLVWLLILISAVFAFWLINLSLIPIRSIFLGDAGSLFLGFTIAWVLIYYTQQPVSLMHPVAALWCVTIPVFDTFVVIARRVKNKRSPFSPDRNHLHYLLVDAGVQPRSTLVVILGGSAMVNIIGIWVTYSVSPLLSLITYCFLLFAYGYAMLNPSIYRQFFRKLRLVD